MLSFGAIDALKRMRLQDLLLRVVYRHGVTALLVTHDGTKRCTWRIV